MDVAWPRRHPGASPVLPQLPQFPGETGHCGWQGSHRAPQLTQRYMVVGPHPGPQLDRIRAVDAEEFFQVKTNLLARAPQLRGGRRQLGQHMGAHPAAGPLGIEFRGYCVVFAAVFCDHPDRDQLDGVPILDEFGVVEVPHRRSLIRPDRAADQNGRGSLRRWCGAHVLVELGVDRALVGHPWRPGDHVLQPQLDPHHRAAPCPFPL
ncbi:Uncharacterised protein [Mycobacterium tuberculosis]|uniref:Uncharacterized protein n=1 Tax=Mycobacterium tuberculosis TaxID=1773 RepID=A0A654T683_MYCTX|nr:Uncharacterised protein [Mycobacterium tuberculosis]CFE47239.1 Uncharacterised protein [Mycobacterium tuberculosis]CKT02586.1 Uncharacterised protein [Mycobacterium tuberculosis]CNV62760.1 Uncharacterised protein [Mycobacterium tuberculosis]COV34852.1 Uncharacterised protein [Mycobacterium tuberculosis]